MYPGSSWYAPVGDWHPDPKRDDYHQKFDDSHLANEGGGTTWSDIHPCVTGRGYTVVDSRKQPFVPLRIGQYANQSNIAWVPFPLREDIIAGYPFIWNPGDDDNQASDRHVIVIDIATDLEYNMWGARLDGFVWSCSNLAIFDMRQGDLQRPWKYTSGDASGCPLSIGLIRGEEIAAGEIKHALRMTMCGTAQRMRPPAQHLTKNSDPKLPPMGQRLRLRRDFPLNKWGASDVIVSPAARTILTCLMDYGAIVCDNGTDFGITGTPDYDTQSSQFTAYMKENVKGSDFEWIIDPNGLADDYWYDDKNEFLPATKPAPTVAFKASQTEIKAGASVNLSWSQAGANFICLGEGGVSRAPSGIRTVTPTRDTWYIAQAMNVGGNTYEQIRILVSDWKQRYDYVDVFVAPQAAGRGDGRSRNDPLPIGALVGKHFAGSQVAIDYSNESYLMGRVIHFADGHYDLTHYAHVDGDGNPKILSDDAGRSPIIQCVGGLPGMPTVYQAETSGGAIFHLAHDCRRGAFGANGNGHVQLIGLTVIGGNCHAFTFEGDAKAMNNSGFLIQSCTVRHIKDDIVGGYPEQCAIRMDKVHQSVIRDLTIDNCISINGKFRAIGVNGCTELYVRRTHALQDNIIATPTPWTTNPAPSTIDCDC